MLSLATVLTAARSFFPPYIIPIKKFAPRQNAGNSGSETTIAKSIIPIPNIDWFAGIATRNGGTGIPATSANTGKSIRIMLNKTCGNKSAAIASAGCGIL
jgi:hypothetical protein